jgi:UDP-glucose 4-epimerase
LAVGGELSPLEPGTRLDRGRNQALRYLITGGAGFIGSHLADALVARGHQAVIVDDFSTGRLANLQQLAANDGCELVEGSVTDADMVESLMIDCDCCLHLASAVGVQLVVSNPLETLRRIVHGTDIVVSSAARMGKRVLFASTSEVYGKNSDGALHEDSDRVLGSAFKSRWSYAIAKSYGEAIAHGYNREHGADTIVFRLFNTIGPRQRGMYGMVVPRFVRQAIQGEDVTVYGDGKQSRCFLHVDDAVRAILALAEREDASGRAFNIGNPTPITILQLAERVIARAGSSSQIRFVPYEEAYDDGFEELGRRRPDTRCLYELTGWHPSRTLDEALDDVIAFQRAELAMEASGLDVEEGFHTAPPVVRRFVPVPGTAAS